MFVLHQICLICCHAAVLEFGKNCDHFSFSYTVINIMADVNIKFLKNYFN